MVTLKDFIQTKKKSRDHFVQPKNITVDPCLIRSFFCPDEKLALQTHPRFTHTAYLGTHFFPFLGNSELKMSAQNKRQTILNRFR